MIAVLGITLKDIIQLRGAKFRGFRTFNSTDGFVVG